MIGKLLGLGIWLVIVPLGMGLVLTNTKLEKEKIGFSWIIGYMMMWSLFQFISVPVILREGTLKQVAFIFQMCALALMFLGFLLTARGCRQQKIDVRKRMGDGLEGPKVVWAIFVGLLLFQFYMSYHLAYADGDDAYYLPISTAANLGGSMYQLDPYTGAPTTLDVRHGLAPFPIWVSFIALKANMNAAVAAHSFIPLVLILLTYVIYLEIGKILAGKALALFMVFISLLQIWGNYSIYPATTFLLTRSRQGKAAFGNIVIPVLVLLLLKMGKELEQYHRISNSYMIVLFFTTMAGCLCSTMAGFLSAMLLMIGMACFAIFYKQPKVLLHGIVGCIPGAVYSMLYLILK